MVWYRGLVAGLLLLTTTQAFEDDPDANPLDGGPRPGDSDTAEELEWKSKVQSAISDRSPAPVGHTAA